MDWFYQYCSGEEFNLPPDTLRFEQFCVIFDVWFKTRYDELGEQAVVAMITELTRRAESVKSPEQAVLFIDSTRKAVKRLSLSGVGEPYRTACELYKLYHESLKVQLSFLKLARITGAEIDFKIPTSKEITCSAQSEDFLFVSSSDDIVKWHIWRQQFLCRPFPLPAKSFYLLFRDSEMEMIEALDVLFLKEKNMFRKLYSTLVEKGLLSHEIFLGEDTRIDKFLEHVSNEPFPIHVKQFHTLINLKREI